MDKFWSRVSKTETCWLWMGAKLPVGYGRFSGAEYSHRKAWELLRGPIPAGLTVDHLCKVKSCCNPDHMEIVSRGENAIRGGGIAASARIRLAKTHCIYGHEYTPENTGTKPNGSRQCLTCRRAMVVKWNRIRDAKHRGRKAVRANEADRQAA